MLAVFGSFFLIPCVANTVELNGRFRSELYIFSENNRDHLRPYESIRADLTAWRGENRSRLSFVTDLRWASNLKNKLQNDPETYIYHLYAKLDNMPTRSTFYLGRQFVYNGLSSAQFDGLRALYKLNRLLQFDFFGGSEVNRLDPESVQSISNFGVWGGRISILPRRKTRVGFSWMLRRNNGSVSQNLMGIDARNSFRKGSLFARLIYNAETSSLAAITTRATYSPARWYLSAEISRREPSLSSNSVFSLIDFDRLTQVRVGIRRDLTSRISLTSYMTTSIFSGEDANRINLGVRVGAYQVSWFYQEGRSGDRSGVRGSAAKRLNPRWNIFAAASISRYRVQTEQADRSDAHTASLGLTGRILGDLLVRAEGQLLRNPVSKSDYRLLLSVTRNFSMGATR